MTALTHELASGAPERVRASAGARVRLLHWLARLLRVPLAPAVDLASTAVDGKVEYACMVSTGEASDAGLVAGMNDAGDLGWEVFLVKPEGGPYQSLRGKMQKWVMFAKRPKRLIAPANELEGLDRHKVS